jgi:hypothetical protein
MSRKKFKVISACYFVFVFLYLIFAIGERDAYPSSFLFFFLLVGCVIGPNVLFLYDQVLKLGEEVESLKEQLGSKASDGSES